ncbi:hypothetical protein [Shewanella sp. SR43-8]|uniref:hypothetical protein n=1 Tax=Shewanella sp. SR43-8 TaxID=2760938 RepID=UPI00160140ED|nr:hypothetical protein [Shewanella sp. SR43-8]MBB1322119.1 hypothetical protein [Shewanella sp. SR43-8]
MGSSSRSASTQATENNSTTFGIQGANNGLILNGSGNTVTDGGAFKLVGDIVDALPIFFSQGAGIISDGFNAVSDFTMSSERQGENVINGAVDIFNRGTDANIEMMRLGSDTLTETGDILRSGLDAAYDFGSDAMQNVSTNADISMQLGRDLASDSMNNNYKLSELITDATSKANDNNTFLSGRSMDNSAYLAETLAKTAMDSGNEANKQATNQLISGFEDMLNFADGYSRSDGSQLAKDNNNTMLLMVGGFAVVVLGAVVIVSRRH